MKHILILLSCLALLVTTSAAFPVAQAATTSVDALTQKKKQLELQAQRAKEEAEKQKTVAQRAAEKVAQVGDQIGRIQQSIVSTQKTIEGTSAQIDQQNQKIAELESNLRRIKDTQDAVVRELYKASVSRPDDMQLFSNEPVSKRQAEEEAFKALKQSVASLYLQTNKAKEEVTKSRNELVQRQQQLESLKVQQDEQRRGLADYRLAQAELKHDAETAVVQLENKEKAARAEAAKIEKQISAALSAIIAARSRGTAINGGQGVGQYVTRGTIVGHMGSTGYSTGPHVHFECRINNSPVNCIPYVNNGTLVYPVSNFVITQGFGYTDYAASGAYGGSIHTGTDLAGPYGQPVYAPANGTVIMNQYYGGYGNAWAMQLDSGLVVLLGHMTGK